MASDDAGGRPGAAGTGAAASRGGVGTAPAPGLAPSTPEPWPAEPRVPTPWAALGTVAVLVPAFQASATIADVVSRTLAVDPSLVPLVVDDGSRDGTGRQALEAGARVLTHAHRRGNGAAIKSGLAATDADVVVMLDGDGPHDPADIPRLLEALLAGADLAVAQRVGFSGSGLWQRWGHRALAALASALAGVALPDVTSGFRAFRTTALRPLVPRQPDGLSTPATTILALLEAGRRVQFVPVHARPRVGPRLMKSGLTSALRVTLGHRPRRAAWLGAGVPLALVLAPTLGADLGMTCLLAFVIAPLAGLVGALAHGARRLSRDRRAQGRGTSISD